MPIFKRWSDENPPGDDGLVVVVLHRENRATVFVSPSPASGVPNPSDVELNTPAALEAAKMQAASYGLETITSP